MTKGNRMVRRLYFSGVLKVINGEYNAWVICDGLIYGDGFLGRFSKPKYSIKAAKKEFRLARFRRPNIYSQCYEKHLYQQDGEVYTIHGYYLKAMFGFKKK